MLIVQCSRKKSVSLLKAKKDVNDQLELNKKSITELQKLHVQAKDVSKLSSRLNSSGLMEDIYGSGQ